MYNAPVLIDSEEQYEMTRYITFETDSYTCAPEKFMSQTTNGGIAFNPSGDGVTAVTPIKSKESSDGGRYQVAYCFC